MVVVEEVEEVVVAGDSSLNPSEPEASDDGLYPEVEVDDVLLWCLGRGHRLCRRPYHRYLGRSG